MKKRNILNTDLEVSAICLGTNRFGTALDERSACEQLDYFVSRGGNFIDTAHSYGNWIPDAPRSASERVIGKWLANNKREDIVLATKGCEVEYDGKYVPRCNPAELKKDLYESLEYLQVNYIDLYWLHRDNPDQPVADIMDALFTHQDEKLIRYFGCSNWSAQRIREANSYAADNQRQGFSACQPMWGLAKPNAEAMQMWSPGFYYDNDFAELHRDGLTMIPYSGQSKGFFGKLKNDGIDLLGDERTQLYLNDSNKKRAKVVDDLAEKHNTSANIIALSYLTSQPLTTIPIIGASSIEQLQESLASADLQLSPQELEELSIT